MRLLGSRYDEVDSGVMTWCRDMKEEHCYVAPPSALSGRTLSLRTQLADENTLGVQGVEVEMPGVHRHGPTMVEIHRERVLVPELLFENGMAHPSLPSLVVQCADRTFRQGLCDQAGLRDLLRQIVLVGGAADFPGMRPRVEFEVRDLILHRYPHLRSELESHEDCFVLNPPLGDDGVLTTPRFVPLIGGCVRAASSTGYAEWSIEQAPPPPSCGEDGVPTLAAGLARVPGLAAWLQRRRMDLTGPTIFRTGGGGGEDDQVWHELLDESEEEPSDEDGLAASDSSSSSSSGDGGEVFLDCASGEPFVPASRMPGAAAATQSGGEEANASTAAAPPPDNARGRSAAGKGRGRGRGRGSRGGRGRSSAAGVGTAASGSGGSASAKGRGKGSTRVWRPVQQP